MNMGNGRSWACMCSCMCSYDVFIIFRCLSEMFLVVVVSSAPAKESKCVECDQAWAAGLYGQE